jgi:hypothetical protein
MKGILKTNGKVFSSKNPDTIHGCWKNVGNKAVRRFWRTKLGLI